jgi:high-affinity iron transporter
MPSPLVRLSTLLCALLLAVAIVPSPARADTAADVQTTWRLIDYLGVDYPGAVRDSRVVSESEYAEMREFAASVVQRLRALPDRPQRARLVADAEALARAIDAKAAPADIERRTRALGGALLAAYPVPLAPALPPELARGAALYSENCAACHGMDGNAATPQARLFDPPPIAFTDRDRAAQRSLFAYYQVIGQGLEGTAMTSFAHLPAQDRWALAFYIAGFSHPDRLAAEGERLWASDPALRARIPDLQRFVALTPAELARDIGPERAARVYAYLRAHPEAIGQAPGETPLGLARALLTQALAAYRAGDRAAATELALRAYLDGFEPVEAALSTRDGSLVGAVEREMGGLRAAIGRGAPAEDVAARAERIQALFERAESALAPSASDRASTFVGAFAILVREGLEALLIVVAMIGFLIKADRRPLLRWVNAGWAIALAAGAATWWVAQRFITISGASREMTEGFGSILAALILLFVGVWMHGKAQAGAWQRYMKERLDHALSKGSGWFLFALAFIAVYREVFETIIFYAALAAEGQGTALLGGFLLAVAVLAAIAWAMLRFSRKLPIAKFFAYSALLIAALAVVLTGKGVAALQEAGFVGVTPLEWMPRIEMLGIFPALESVAAQIVMVGLLVAGYVIADRRGARPTDETASASA